MKKFAAFQLLLAATGIFAQAGTISFPYFNMGIVKDPPDIYEINFGVVPEGQDNSFHCKATLQEASMPYNMASVSGQKLLI